MSKKGFTLAELLAVIVVLGIIAAITIPKVVDVIKEQRKKTDTVYLTSVAKEVDEYITVYSTTLGKVGLYESLKGEQSEKNDSKGNYITTSVSNMEIDLKEFEVITLKLYDDLDYQISAIDDEFTFCVNSSGQVSDGSC